MRGRPRQKAISPPEPLKTFEAPPTLAQAGLSPPPRRGSKAAAQLVRDQIIESLGSLGGVNYLVALGREEPSTYAMLLARVLPLQLTGEDGGAIEVVHTFKSEI